MKYQFDVRFSKPVQVLVPKAVRQEIIREAITLAEKETSGMPGTIHFRVNDWDLHVAIQFSERLIAILTTKEAKKLGFPEPQRGFQDN